MPDTAELESRGNKRAPANVRLSHIKKRHYNADEAAYFLGISIQHLHRLRERHPLYRPDVLKPNGQARENVKPATLNGTKKRGRKEQDPLWSRKLLKFISHAWSVTQEGPIIRELEDDEAYELWMSRREKARERIKKKAGY